MINSILIKYYFIFSLLFCIHLNSQHKNQNVELSFIAKNLEWKGVAVQDKDYTIWGCAPIQDTQGLTHLFVARWPEKNVNPAWRKSSEIAHYVADHPEGPFKFSDVAIQGTGKNAWDKYAPHNPEIKKGGGTLWKSKDGIRFKLEDATVGYELLSTYYKKYDPAKVIKIYGGDSKLERPKILMIDGKPAYLYGPSGWNFFGKDRTVGHVLKIVKN